MLSTITCTKDNKYSFYVQTEVWDELDLVITNGRTVWINNDEINERKITYECRPNSRKKESKISYLNALKAALIVDPAVIALDLPNRIKYTYEVAIAADDILSLTIKEQLPETTLLTILYKGSFSPKPNAVTSVMELLETFGNLIHSKTKSIQEFEKKTQELNQLIEKNVQTIQELNESKETLQTSMIQKMCVVLNTKKHEIQQLREQQSKSQKSSASHLPPLEEEEEQEVVPVKTTTARGRKAAATTAAKKKEVPAKATTTTKRATASRKSNLDKIQANVKAGKRTNKKKVDSEEEEEVNFDEDDDDEEEALKMEIDALYDSSEGEEEEEEPSRPAKRTRRGRKPAAVDSDEEEEEELPPASSSKGIDFDRIRQLAQEFDLKKTSTNESDDDSSRPAPVLSNPRAKEVHSSQISDFLSSQSEHPLVGNSSSNVGGGLFGKPILGDGDDSNHEDDEKSVSKPAIAEPPRRIFQGMADQNKKSKSRRLLDDSDDD